MAISLNRFVFETQTWRTVRTVGSFVDALAYIEEQTNSMHYSDEKLEEFERIGMVLSSEVHKWNDVSLNLNTGGDMILRHNRAVNTTIGRMYINIRASSVHYDCRAYSRVRMITMFGEGPYQELRECVRWIHSR